MSLKPSISSEPYTHEAHAKRCVEAAKAREVLFQYVQAKRGQIVYCAVIKAAYTVPNGTAWVSIAKFLEVDPLIKLGLSGGWCSPARGASECTEAAPARSGARTGAASAAGGCVVEKAAHPLGNHGDNN